MTQPTECTFRGGPRDGGTVTTTLNEVECPYDAPPFKFARYRRDSIDRSVFVYKGDRVKPGTAYYFGVWDAGRSGHYLHSPWGDKVWQRDNESPWAVHELDGKLLPSELRGGYEPQGHARLVKKDGWTAIAFWDRSGDGRHASNSAFLFEGDWTFEQAKMFAADIFPHVWQRFTFEVVQDVR